MAPLFAELEDGARKADGEARRQRAAHRGRAGCGHDGHARIVGKELGKLAAAEQQDRQTRGCVRAAAGPAQPRALEQCLRGQRA